VQETLTDGVLLEISYVLSSEKVNRFILASFDLIKIARIQLIEKIENKFFNCKIRILVYFLEKDKES
jgi:hypothetical protein